MNDCFLNELQRAQSGDKQAAEEIFKAYMPLIEKYSYIRSRTDEDLLGELYLAAYKCIMRFEVNQSDFKEFLAEAAKEEKM